MNVTQTTLRIGNHGRAVVDLQRELKAAGYDPHGIDGDFGPLTRAALVAYQRAHHLVVDGVVGHQTWTELKTDRFKPSGTAPPPAGTTTTSGSGDTRSGGRLFGADTSHWQSDSEFARSIQGAKFSAIKATDGHTYTDPTFRRRWNMLGDKIQNGSMKLRIAYHFLEPGDGKGQAKHFLDTLGIHGKLKPGTRLALDWEASALRSPQTLHDAAKYIHDVTGTWPLIYTSASNVPTARREAPHAPIWAAQWTGGLQNHSTPFVQYDDGPNYDHDVFNGSLADLEKFAGWR